MKIHHIGYLVEDIDSTTNQFKYLGFEKVGNKTTDDIRRIYVQFLDNNGVIVELVQPIDENSQVFNLMKRYKNSPYHLCYSVDNIETACDILCRNGDYMLITAPQEAPAISGTPDVVFLMNANAGIIELVEEREKNDDR